MNKFRHTIAAFTVLIVLLLLFFSLRDRSGKEEKVRALPVADVMKTPDKPANGNATDIPGDTIRSMEAGMKETLVVAGARFRLRFEDGGQPELTDDLRQQITGDLQLIFGHMRSFELQSVGERSFKVNGHEVRSDTKVNFNGGKRLMPEPVNDHFGYATKNGSSFVLTVEDSLIKAYLAAFAFRKAHEKAFSELEPFLQELHSVDPVKFSGYQRTIIWSPAGGNLNPEILAGIENQMRSVRIRRPSILEYYPSDGGVSSGLTDLPGEAIYGRAVDLGSSGQPNNYTPLVYVDGMWKIAVLKPGT